MLTVEALPASGSVFDLDVALLGCEMTIAPGADGGNHVVLHDGASHLRLDVRAGFALDGAVRIHIVLDRLDRADCTWAALDRLRETIATGRLARRPLLQGERCLRAVTALRCWDARQTGASQRDMAALMVGPARARSEWNMSSDYLRSRVRRALRFAEEMVEGGWQRLLDPRKSGQIRLPAADGRGLWQSKPQWTAEPFGLGR